jgi:hypothetical protein
VAGIRQWIPRCRYSGQSGHAPQYQVMASSMVVMESSIVVMESSIVVMESSIVVME